MNNKRINWIFSQLHGAHGNVLFEKFRSGQVVNGEDSGISNMKAVWDQGIDVRRLTNEEVIRAVNVCMQSKFAPNLAEFLEAAKPAVEPLKAYYEAIEGMNERASGKAGKWSHPAIYWAASRMGHELRTQTYSVVRQQWERSLQSELDKGTWEPVPAAQQSIAYERAKVSPERVREACQAIQNKDKQDHHAWWKKILTKHKNSPKLVPQIALSMALEAQRNCGRIDWKP